MLTSGSAFDRGMVHWRQQCRLDNSAYQQVHKCTEGRRWNVSSELQYPPVCDSAQFTQPSFHSTLLGHLFGGKHLVNIGVTVQTDLTTELARFCFGVGVNTYIYLHVW